jgi:NADH:ubiquinone oxidoreductase subunit 6 (subunit J)
MNKFMIPIITSSLLALSNLIVGLQSPIHAILTLILIFVFGSILLILLCMEYFALLFLIVYVGAIVVLFLFIVMMLEIKMVSGSERFLELFSFKNIVMVFLVLEILIFANANLLHVTDQFKDIVSFQIVMPEINLYTNYSKILLQAGQLRAIGNTLFTEYFFTLILISILLFVSMFGAIVMTLKFNTKVYTKIQDSTLQVLAALVPIVEGMPKTPEIVYYYGLTTTQ